MDLYLIPIYVFIFILGTVVGSFLNVCIIRIPLGQSIAREPSHCMSCHKKLHWYELVPVLSWLLLKGKCSGCGAPISAQYPLVEMANGLLWLAVALRCGFTADALLGCVLVSVLLVASVIDARTKELPRVTTGTVAVLGIIRILLHPQYIKTGIFGMVAVGGFLLLLLILSGGSAIGGGDVKLMAGSGLFLGLQLNVLAFLLGCVIGSFIHIIRMKFFGAGRELAMGPYLSVGIVIAFLYGNAMIDWYMAMLLG